MRTINTWIGSFLIIAGIIAMAGSANDCDGACMDQANTLGEMLMVLFIGFCLFATGAVFLLKQNSN
jgi:hypothetical protein